MIHAIYRIRNILNKKVYIGSSVDIERRWYEHKSHLRLNKHGNKHLQNAWNKYWEIVAEIRKRLADGETQKALAKEYGIATSPMNRIANNTAWIVDTEESA